MKKKRNCITVAVKDPFLMLVGRSNFWVYAFLVSCVSAARQQNKTKRV